MRKWNIKKQYRSSRLKDRKDEKTCRTDNYFAELLYKIRESVNKYIILHVLDLDLPSLKCCVAAYAIMAYRQAMLMHGRSSKCMHVYTCS